MLDGKRYFASFPDERQAAPDDSQQAAKPRLATPGLLAALDQLGRELRSFLDETSDDRRA